MDDAVRNYLKWRIDELNPEQVRKVIRYVGCLFAVEKEIKNALATDQSMQGTQRIS